MSTFVSARQDVVRYYGAIWLFKVSVNVCLSGPAKQAWNYSYINTKTSSVSAFSPDLLQFVNYCMFKSEKKIKAHIFWLKFDFVAQPVLKWHFLTLYLFQSSHCVLRVFIQSCQFLIYHLVLQSCWYMNHLTQSFSTRCLCVSLTSEIDRYLLPFDSSTTEDFGAFFVLTLIFSLPI